MKQSFTLIIPVILPIVAGLILLFQTRWENKKTIRIFTGAALLITALFVGVNVFKGEQTLTLFYITKTLPIFFRLDQVGRVFVSIVTIVWLLAGFFSFEYMNHEEKERRYFGFYLLVYGILVALDFSGNLITFYIFYELMTLTSMPLVLHSGTKESIMAALKYMFYSFAGAYMVLYGIYFLNRYTNSLSFTAGGTLDTVLTAGNEPFLLVVAFLMIVGFGVKAGMFPLHAWLPTAHPVAPAPASAALSGIIVKAGVLGIIRVIFFLFGADFIRGSWVQSVWLGFTLLTVFMGSMLAYREKIFKKRLAYSTVSQISYILFGIALLNPTALTGAFLHTICHAFIKCGLFLTAGAIIYKTGKIEVDELRGIGKQMPITIWCYTFLSLALIGIPPTGGFVSKWYLAVGSLQSGISVFAWLGPVILLASALLTAGYLLPVTIQGFLPGDDFDYEHLEKKEPSRLMVIPILILTALAVLIGCFPNPVLSFVTGIVNSVL